MENLRQFGVRCPCGTLKTWIIALFLYCMLAYVLMEDSGELLTEEDHISLRDWVKDNEDVLRREYHRRGEIAHKVCEKYDIYVSHAEYIKAADNKQPQIEYSDWLALKRVNWDNMYYAPIKDFVYCKVPKSGSSTWVHNLLKLAKVPDERISSDIGLHKLVRDYYPKVTSSRMKRAFKRSLKLIVVRHPFDRLLSAYRDKLEDYQRDLMFREGYYYTMYGKNIVHVYRDTTDLQLTNRTEPTWSEFVRYIINTPASKFDEHWRPIYMLCSPCVIKFNVVSKMDTFNEDTQFVINQLGQEDQLHVEWIHRTSESKTTELARYYFSQLTPHQVDQLYKRYKLDFELFGYYYDDYKEMAE